MGSANSDHESLVCCISHGPSATDGHWLFRGCASSREHPSDHRSRNPFAHGNITAHQYPDANRHSGSHGYTGADQHASANPYLHAGTNTHGYALARTYSDPGTYCYSYAYPDCHSDVDTETDSYPCCRTYSQPHPRAGSVAEGLASGNRERGSQ